MSYKSGGTNLDSIFAARLAAKRPDIGYRLAGTDISNRYEPLRGGSPKVPATGIRVGGVDLNMFFDNTSETPVNFSGTADAENFGIGAAGCEIGFRPNGTMYGFTSPSGPVTVSPEWFTPGRPAVGNEYDIHFHVNSASGGVTGSGFDAWMQLNVDRYVIVDAPGSLSFNSAEIQAIIRLRSTGARVCSGILRLSAQAGADDPGGGPPI